MSPPAVAAVVSLRALTACCVSLALHSSPILRNVARPGGGDTMLGLVNKGGKPGERDFDPQTVADRRSQRFIETNLKMAFPDVRIVGEEGDLGAVDPEDEAVMKELASIRPDLSCLHNKWKDAADLLLPAKDLCVWIDPLDGTREFTEGRFNYVSTLVGVTWKGRPVSGVIAEPYYYDYNDRPADVDPSQPARAMWGTTHGDVGAQVFGEPSWKPGAMKDGRCIITTSRSRTEGPVKDTLDGMEHVMTEHVVAGGSGHKMARCIEGVSDIWLYPASGTSKWDSCPGEAIMQSIGGYTTDARGNPIVYDADAPDYYNTHGVLCSRNKKLLEEAVKAAAPSMGAAPA